MSVISRYFWAVLQKKRVMRMSAITSTAVPIETITYEITYALI